MAAIEDTNRDYLNDHLKRSHPAEYEDIKMKQKSGHRNKKFQFKSSLRRHYGTGKLTSGPRWPRVNQHIHDRVESSHRRLFRLSSTSTSNGIPKKRKPNPFLTFVKQMRPVVVSELSKEMAKQGLPLQRGQVIAELGKQWHRLSHQHKNIFLNMCQKQRDEQNDNNNDNEAIVLDSDPYI